MPQPAGHLDLPLLKKAGEVVEHNAAASVLDLGDGVFCLEFHSQDERHRRRHARHDPQGDPPRRGGGAGLVIANQGPGFSAGANLALLAMAIAEGAFDEIALTVTAFQKAMMALKYAKVPVVAAPHGLALGGGCEICLHATP